MSLICIGVLSYWIAYSDGMTSYHSVYVTKEDKVMIERLLSSPKFKKDFEVNEVYKKKFKPIKPRNCNAFISNDSPSRKADNK